MRPSTVFMRLLSQQAIRRYTQASSPAAAPDFDKIRSSMLARKPKVIPDYLNPMQSHLLTTTLDDLLLQHQHSTTTTSSPKIQQPAPFLPQAHHLVYFPIQAPPSRLLPDGADPDHSPGEPFTRRMWAGGEITFSEGWESALAMDGRPWVCREKVEGVTVKGGGNKGGEEKLFVDVVRRYGEGHETEGREWDIVERRTLVFMRNKGPEGTAAKAKIIKYPHQPTHSVSLTPNARHLFIYSALTFNAHLIHLDPAWAKATDGHRGLLVHGPLSLTLMLHVLTDRLKEEGVRGARVSSISYRNHAPLYAGEKITVGVRKLDEKGRWDTWVEGPEGGLAVKGSVQVDLGA